MAARLEAPLRRAATREHRYCVDEVLELVREAGFRVERHSFRRLEYMQSPASTQGRTETVLTFSAERLAG